MTETATTTDLEFHPLANIFPLIEGAEFEELVADIRENGLREPIVLHEGKILDGRNRWRALVVIGKHGLPQDGRSTITPATREVAADPLAYVISKNLRRRHLTDQQRAAIAAELATMGRGRPSENPPIGGITEMTTAQAAAALQVPQRSVEREKQRMRTDPEAHAKAKAGTLERRKPTKPEKRLRQNLGEQRAAAFVERHPEMDPAHARVTTAIRELRRALPQSFDANAWALAQPEASRASLLEDLRHVRTMVDVLMAELRRLESNVFAEPEQVDLEDIIPPEPQEELSEELAVELRLRDACAEGGRRRLEEALAHVAEHEAAQGNGELRNGYADNPVELGRRVREARKARGWTQGELAEVARTHAPIVSQIERGKLEKVGKATLQRVTHAVL